MDKIRCGNHPNYKTCPYTILLYPNLSPTLASRNTYSIATNTNSISGFQITTITVSWLLVSTEPVRTINQG